MASLVLDVPSHDGLGCGGVLCRDVFMCVMPRCVASFLMLLFEAAAAMVPSRDFSIIIPSS